ncbi:MAG: restriction endonuclease subunit S [Leptospiraceae bacterium]|nr:restriction endonuclease subunit S [Leptospiraceae bacterium]
MSENKNLRDLRALRGEKNVHHEGHEEHEEKKPEIRFQGYNDEWEEKELGEVVDVKSGQDYKHLSKGDIPVFGTGGYMLSVNEALSYTEDAIGIGRKGTIDKPYILKAPFWTVDTLFYALPKENNKLDFIYPIFQSINWRQKGEYTGVPSLARTAINKTLVNIPSPAEQAQIGTFFQKIDTLIVLRQKKLDKLKNTKKAFLNKMFPKEGSDVPEIRFEGFSGKWERKKLERLTEINQGLQIAISKRYTEYVNGSYFYITNEFLKENPDVKYYILNPPESVICKESDVLMTRTGNTGHVVTNVSGAFHNNFFKIKFSQKELNKNFFVCFLKLPNTQELILKLAGTSTIPDLNHKDFYGIKIVYPTIEEQTKIGNFFQTLDRLLGLQEKEIEKLKELKKAFLEKMFV